jgi:hypothetical protein
MQGTLRIRPPEGNTARSSTIRINEDLLEEVRHRGACSWGLYVGYVVVIAIVDTSALLRLNPNIAAWVHITITLTLSVVAVGFIGGSLAYRHWASASHRKVLVRLLRAHNERARSAV